MAVIKKRVDDVLHAQGKDVEATERTRVTVPALATNDGKAARLDLDVSPQGKAALDKMLREAQEATRKAWAPVLALKPRREAPRRKAEAPKASEAPHVDANHEHQPAGQHPEPQHDPYGHQG